MTAETSPPEPPTEPGLPLVECRHGGPCAICGTSTTLRDARVDVHVCSEKCWREEREFFDVAAGVP